MFIGIPVEWTGFFSDLFYRATARQKKCSKKCTPDRAYSIYCRRSAKVNILNLFSPELSPHKKTQTVTQQVSTHSSAISPIPGRGRRFQNRASAQ